MSRNAKIHAFTNKKTLRDILEKHYDGHDNRKIIWSLYILEKSIGNALRNSKVIKQYK